MNNYSFRYSSPTLPMKMSDLGVTPATPASGPASGLVAGSVEQLVAAFGEPILASLGGRFGLAPQVLADLTRRSATTILIAVMSRCIEPHQALLDAVMSPEVDARARERLAELTETTTALKRLEGLGLAALMVALEREPAPLSDIVSARTGVPAQAAHAWTGLASAVFFGQLKRQMLLDQARDTGGIQRTLLLQWPAVSGQVDDALAAALGFEGKDALAMAVSSAHEKVMRQTPYGVVSMLPDGSIDAGAGLQPVVVRSSSWRGMVIGCLLGAVIGASAMYALVFEGVVQMPMPQPVAAARVATVLAMPPAASGVPPVAASSEVAVASSAAVAASSVVVQTPPVVSVSEASSPQANAAPGNGVPAVLLPSAPPLPGLPASSGAPAR